MTAMNRIAAAMVVCGSVAVFGGGGCAVQADETADEAMSADDRSPQPALGTSEDAIWGARRGGYATTTRRGYVGGGGYHRGAAYSRSSSYAYGSSFSGGYGMYY